MESMIPNRLTALCCGVFFLIGCKEYAYYQSPFQGVTSSYRAMPAAGDSVHAATYISGHFFTGGANDRLRDEYNGFTASVHRGTRFGHFRSFYGASLVLGNYSVDPVGTGNPRIETSYPDYDLLNSRAGSKFFGGVGAGGGLYLTEPFRNGGEWRVLGVEMNYLREFGAYYKFRSNLPDSAANIIERSANYMSIGFHSDFEFRIRRGYTGLKLGAVFSLHSLSDRSSIGYADRVLPGYFSFTYHATWQRTTGFLQFNAGTHSANLMMGINCRLGHL